jgi:hypothetical protein
VANIHVGSNSQSRPKTPSKSSYDAKAQAQGNITPLIGPQPAQVSPQPIATSGTPVSIPGACESRIDDKSKMSKARYYEAFGKVKTDVDHYVGRPRTAKHVQRATLLKLKDSVWTTNAKKAVMTDNPHVLHKLRKNMYVNELVDEKQNTLLLYALENGKYKSAIYLLKQFRDTIDVNAKNTDKKTALHFTCKSDQKMLFDLLLNFDDLEATENDQRGQNPTVLVLSNTAKGLPNAEYMAARLSRIIKKKQAANDLADGFRPSFS